MKTTAIADRLDALHPLGREVITFVAMVTGFVVLDRATRKVAQLSDNDIEQPVLLISAVRARPVLVAMAIVVGVGALVLVPQLRAGWDRFEHGRALRWFALPVVVLLAWADSMYGYNFLAGQWHLFDRVAVVALAVAAWRWPIVLVPLAAQLRIVTHQFDQWFSTTSGQNIDELLVMALLCIAAVVVVGVLLGIDDTAWVLVLLMALVASHFFLPGRSKIPLDWATTNDLAHFPVSAYTAGWRGAGDGTWARRVSDFVDTYRVPLRLGTLVLELGALIAVAHVRRFRLWVPGWVLFHLGVLVFTGYWFGSWIAVEFGLLVLLLVPSLREWSTRHANVTVGALTVLLVIIGSHVFHPPRLAWLDGPVSYGLEVTATGDSGTVYRVPPSAFAPLVQEIAFVRLPLAGTREAAAAYGAIGTKQELAALEELRSIDDLAAYEQTLGPTFAVPGSNAERFSTAWLDHANARSVDPWYLVGPLPHFRTSVPGPVYRGQERLVSLVVTRVAALDLGNTVEYRRDEVLQVDVDAAGVATVVARWND